MTKNTQALLRGIETKVAKERFAEEKKTIREELTLDFWMYTILSTTLVGFGLVMVRAWLLQS